MEPLTTSCRQQIQELYAEVDREIDPHQHLCKMRGICCDFPKAPHTLFASELEVRFALELAPPDWQPQGELCPFWREGLCTAREFRPLGCRTYFCDPSWAEQGDEVYERFHRRLQTLAAAVGVPYRYEPWVSRLQREGTRPNRLDPPRQPT